MFTHPDGMADYVYTVLVNDKSILNGTLVHRRDDGVGVLLRKIAVTLEAKQEHHDV